MGRHACMFALLPAVFAVYIPFCTAHVQPTMQPWEAPLGELWKRPADVANADFLDGEWGASHAPDPRDTYTLVEMKRHGINAGMTVRDSKGRRWSVKQGPSDGQPGEGPAEVVLSRVLDAIGYHQPPVYYLPTFTLADDWSARPTRGGRFRLHEPALKDVGEWSWQQNPFVGMRPYQGLLVVLLLFNSSDLKNANNALYEHRRGDYVERWYVVQDLGTALGNTGRVAPVRSDPAAFERHRFIMDVQNGFVRFDYQGWHQELVRDRITPDDVGWACELLSRISDRQWQDAFRAGGYLPEAADRFIRKLQANIALGRRIGGDDWSPLPERH